MKIDNESWGRSHNWVVRPVITETADGEFNLYIYSKQEGSGAFGQFNATLDFICDEDKKSISIDNIDNFKGVFTLSSTKNESLSIIENFANSKNLKFRISGITGDKHPLTDLSNENLKSHFQLMAADFLNENKWESQVQGFRENYKNYLINEAIEGYKTQALWLSFVVFVAFILLLDKILKVLF